MREGRVGRMLAASALSAVLLLSACSTEWIAEAERIVAALIPAVANLVTLVTALEGKSVSASDVQTVQNAGKEAGADLQLVQSLMAAYEKADETAKPGILNQIQAAIGAAQGSLEGLLPALHIKDTATQAKVTAVVRIVLAEVQSLGVVMESQGAGIRDQNDRIPTQAKTGLEWGTGGKIPTSGKGGQKWGTREKIPTSGKGGQKWGTRTPLAAGEFVKSYNATLTAKTGNAELDRAAAGMQVHLHGKVERWVTAGAVK